MARPEAHRWRHGAVAMVLLDGDWISIDGDVDPSAVIGKIKDLASRETRNHKLLAQTQLSGYLVLMLDRSMFSNGDTLMPLVKSIPDPATTDGVLIHLGFADERLNRVLGSLQPDEQRVALSSGYAEGGEWSSAAVAAGLPPEYGERVRRKCKRKAAELTRRAAATRPGGEPITGDGATRR